MQHIDQGLQKAWTRSSAPTKSKPAKAPAPFSVRLNAAQRKQLERAADGKPLGAYVRSLLFESDGGLSSGKARTVRDAEALAQALAKLGQSGLGQSLASLAKSAHLGALPTTSDVLESIEAACIDVREIRLLLIKALGLRPKQ